MPCSVWFMISCVLSCLVRLYYDCLWFMNVKQSHCYTKPRMGFFFSFFLFWSSLRERCHCKIRQILAEISSFFTFTFFYTLKFMSMIRHVPRRLLTWVSPKEKINQGYLSVFSFKLLCFKLVCFNWCVCGCDVECPIHL